MGNKLRSSAIPCANATASPPKDISENAKKEDGEKPVVVRFKRVRKSELSLLSDEAESFMFGEPKRDDSSERSEDEQSSVMPKDTESEHNENESRTLNSSELSNHSNRLEENEDDSMVNERSNRCSDDS